MKATAFILSIFMCVLASCHHTKYHDKYRSWHEKEARYYDIPLFISAKPEFSTKSKEEDESLSYSVEASLETIISFYQQEMERAGWHCYSFFEGSEPLFVYEKPTKTCAIYFRKQKNNMLVKIFLNDH